MADLQTLNIVIGANTTAADQGLQKVSKELANTAIAAQKVDSSIGKAGSTVAKSTTNFTGLNRVIQDLPFGFIAISNNLEQLLPAAGALGTVFSAIIATITLLQIGFRNWTGRTKEATEATDEFAKSLKGAESGALATGVKLQGFVNIAKDQTKTLEERNNALREANEIIGKHGEKLTLATIATKEATDEIQNFTQALINEALATKYADKIADLLIAQSAAIKEYAKTKGEYIKVAKEANEIDKVTFSGGTGGVGGLGNVSTITKVAGAYNDVSKAASSYKDITGQLRDSYAEFNKLQVAGLTTDRDDTKVKKEKIKTLEELQAELRKTLYSMQRLYGWGSSEKPPFQPVKINDSILKLSDIEAKNALEKMRETLRKAGKDVFSNQGILTGIDLLNDDEVKKNFANLQEGLKKTAAIVTDVLGVAFQSVFQSIQDGSSVFEALGKAIKQVIVKLVAAVVEAAILATIINLISGGTGSILGGFSGIFSQLSGLPKFASGGVVTRPTLALVGEQGPERITPLNQINNNSGNNIMAGEVVFQINGNTLRGVLRRADQEAYNTF